METSMTVSVHQACLGNCASYPDCDGPAHITIMVGRDIFAYCMECAVDKVQDNITNMAIASYEGGR